MTKNEFIERYGEEAYQRKLEHQKRYYQQHIEEKKQRYQQRREEINQYQKQYYQQHREEINQRQKQYDQQHIEEKRRYNKQRSRNNKQMFAYCIPEQIEQIENYELAKESNFNGWHIHHRLETHNSDGEKRLVNLSKAELIALDMYYNRPASELVFLTASEHTSLHNRSRRKQS